MSEKLLTYKIDEVRPYISWTYFFHAWGFAPCFATIAYIHGCDACRASWLASFPVELRTKASEAMQLYKEANRLLDVLASDYETYAVSALFPVHSDGDNLLIYREGNTPMRFPLLRQQTVKSDGASYLCLSDFVPPLSHKPDTIGVFAASVSTEMEQLYASDPYKHLLVQTLADRLAEASAERLHEYVRKEAWGYAREEQLSIPEILANKYQGIRPAVGYPSLPDQSVVFLLDELLDMGRIGIHLTENGAMIPHASVCGLMFSHPAAHYFSVGVIGEDQFVDYCYRRGKSPEEMRKFLSGNLQSL